MFKITILASEDNDKIGQFTFYKNLIYVGNHKSCDLYINDKDIIPNHIFIEIIGSKMLIHPNKDVDHILVSGKRTTGHKYTEIGQEIKIGSTVFRIDLFGLTTIEPSKNELNKLTEQIIENNPKVLKILQDYQESIK